jgi:hypothetical protein
MIHHAHLLFGAAHAQPLRIQRAESLRAGVLVHDVQIGVKRDVLIVDAEDRVVPCDLLVKRLSHRFLQAPDKGLSGSFALV